MTYPNLHAAVASLGAKLDTFAGHGIRPDRTSFCFDTLARGLEYIRLEPAAAEVNYEATILADGRALPVIVSLKGTGICQPCEVSIRIA